MRAWGVVGWERRVVNRVVREVVRVCVAGSGLVEVYERVVRWKRSYRRG